MWLQPGGHIELNEDPLQGLEHELLEETGLELSKCRILEPAEQPKVRDSKTLPLPFHFNVHGFDEKHKHIDLEYIIISYTDQIKPDKRESQEFGWFDLKQIMKLNNDNKLHNATLDICEWILTKHA
jgi:8-oxo-dGTP pyrophosphatase MutT (NUDIX family)